jgi:hypothetical protein
MIQQNYILDMLTMKLRRLEDGILQFRKGVSLAQTTLPEKVASSA